jgi:hypothetical protein
MDNDVLEGKNQIFIAAFLRNIDVWGKKPDSRGVSFTLVTYGHWTMIFEGGNPRSSLPTLIFETMMSGGKPPDSRVYHCPITYGHWTMIFIRGKKRFDHSLQWNNGCWTRSMSNRA